jgi:hypothetical protein
MSVFAAVTAGVVNVTVAEVAPAGIVIELDESVKPVRELTRLTTVPPVGAALARRIVRVTGEPPVTDAALVKIPNRRGAASRVSVSL